MVHRTEKDHRYRPNSGAAWQGCGTDGTRCTRPLPGWSRRRTGLRSRHRTSHARRSVRVPV